MSDSYSLVFNIGSGNISGSIIKFTEKPGIEVIFYAQEAISFQKEISIDQHLELMKKALALLLEKFQKKGFKIVNIYYLFSSPWSTSQTKTIKVKENKNFKLSEKYFKKIIADQEKLISAEGDILKQGKLIENKIVQIKANGYIINEPNDKLVREVEVSLFLTTVPNHILQEIEGVANKFFRVKNIWCHSTALAMFSVIRDLFPHQEDFISIDISEEMTDLSIIKENVIVASVSFPFGRNQFIRQLSQKLNLTEALADSMIKMQSLKSHDALATVNFNSAMAEIINSWSDQVNISFDKLGESLSLPSIIFFIAANDLASSLILKLKEKTPKVVALEARKITSPIKIDNIILKIGLVFLDKIYKI